jgi:hypothetical protein
MKLFFSGAINAGREKTPFYLGMIAFLKSLGHDVLDDFIFNNEPLRGSPRDIFLEDLGWIDEADALIAEVSVPSNGVGCEIMYASHVSQKPVLCLYYEGSEKKLSLMLAGNPRIICVTYSTFEEACQIVSSFLREI